MRAALAEAEQRRRRGRGPGRRGGGPRRQDHRHRPQPGGGDPAPPPPTPNSNCSAPPKPRSAAAGWTRSTSTSPRSPARCAPACWSTPGSAGSSSAPATRTAAAAAARSTSPATPACSGTSPSPAASSPTNAAACSKPFSADCAEKKAPLPGNIRMRNFQRGAYGIELGKLLRDAFGRDLTQWFRWKAWDNRFESYSIARPNSELDRPRRRVPPAAAASAANVYPSPSNSRAVATARADREAAATDPETAGSRAGALRRHPGAAHRALLPRPISFCENSASAPSGNSNRPRGRSSSGQPRRLRPETHPRRRPPPAGTQPLCQLRRVQTRKRRRRSHCCRLCGGLGGTPPPAPRRPRRRLSPAAGRPSTWPLSSARSRPAGEELVTPSCRFPASAGWSSASRPRCARRIPIHWVEPYDPAAPPASPRAASPCPSRFHFPESLEFRAPAIAFPQKSTILIEYHFN